jgi:hypothetical protein
MDTQATDNARESTVVKVTVDTTLAIEDYVKYSGGPYLFLSKPRPTLDDDEDDPFAVRRLSQEERGV